MKSLMLKAVAVVMLTLGCSGPTFVLADQSGVVSTVCQTAINNHQSLAGCTDKDGNALPVASPDCQNAINKHVELAGCTDKDGNALDPSTQTKLDQKNGYFNTLANVFIYAGGLVSVIFLIVGGVRYLTSTGDASRIQQAKDTVFYAIAGLIIVAIARALLGFVIGIFQ